MGILLKGGRIVTENKIFKGDIKIENEKIISIDKEINPDSKDKVFYLKDKILMPGIIDSHVHYRMYKNNIYTTDTFETASKAAICGGVTTIIDYAEPIKGLSIIESLKSRIEEAKNHIFVDYSMHMTISGKIKYNYNDLELCKKFGINSLKLYTTYDFILSYKSIEKILIEASKLGIVVTVHAEDNELLEKSLNILKKSKKFDVSYFPKSRPVEAEIKAVKKLIEICKKNDVAVHIVHVSSGYTGRLIEAAKRNKIKITAETCPHYLFLNDNVYSNKKNAALFVMQPPLRSEKERKLLLDQVRKGIFDFITTDHCAYSPGQKFLNKNFYEISGGIPGTETLLPLLWSEYVSKKLFDEKMCMKMLSLNPAKLFGLYPQKGTLKVGSDADIVIIDPKVKKTITKKIVHTAAKYSTFEGFNLIGYPIMTILRGKIAFNNDCFCLCKPIGKYIKIKN